MNKSQPPKLRPWAESTGSGLTGLHAFNGYELAWFSRFASLR